MKKITFLFTALILGMTLLTSCQNTVSGLGEDMQNNGKAIRKAINS